MKLIVGYIPEHFSAPMMLALHHGFYKNHGVDVEFRPFPSGSGHLIQCLKEGSINFAVGLTEAFVRSIASGATEFKLVGTYVQTPLQWAVSVGAKRADLTQLSDVEGKKCGVSRMGSGSDVMSRVFRADHGFTKEFDYVVLDTFKRLRDAVNDGTADFFMWEHFTSKRYYDSGEIRRIGHIYTPWPSWVTVTATGVPASTVDQFIAAVNDGINYFRAHTDEAIKWIYTNLDYSEEDARAWLQTVQFSDNAGIIDQTTIDKTVRALQHSAGLSADAMNLQYTYK